MGALSVVQKKQNMPFFQFDLVKYKSMLEISDMESNISETSFSTMKQEKRVSQENWRDDKAFHQLTSDVIVKALSVAWKEMLANPRIIKRAFEKPGLSLALDGSEDGTKMSIEGCQPGVP